jgi:cellulose synthase (UDP-forming)
MQNYLYGEFRWPWISELYEYAQSLYMLPALVSVLLHPNSPTFTVTAKDESIGTDRLSEIAWPLFAFFLLLIAGVIMTIMRLITQPYQADVTMVVGAWNLLNLLLAGCALGVVSERGERQASRRVPVQRRCEVLTDGVVIQAAIENVSSNGAGLRLTGSSVDIARLEVIELRISTLAPIGVDPVLPCMVRHVRKSDEGTFVGVRYQATSAAHFQIVADLMFANSDQWTTLQSSRRVNPGLIRGTIWFYGLAFREMARGLLYLGRLTRGDRLAALKNEPKTEDAQ